nr:hypothetical protein CFP56_54853 [Quercus suber]
MFLAQWQHVATRASTCVGCHHYRGSRNLISFRNIASASWLAGQGPVQDCILCIHNPTNATHQSVEPAQVTADLDQFSGKEVKPYAPCPATGSPSKDGTALPECERTPCGTAARLKEEHPLEVVRDARFVPAAGGVRAADMSTLCDSARSQRCVPPQERAEQKSCPHISQLVPSQDPLIGAQCHTSLYCSFADF